MKANKKQCSTGGCGSSGMCPGTAMVLASLVGLGAAALSDSELIGWVVGIPLAIALILGLPQKILAKLFRS